MNEYLITVTSEVTKHYLIDASSNEEAISKGLDYYIEGTNDLENGKINLTDINVKIESIDKDIDEEID